MDKPQIDTVEHTSSQIVNLKSLSESNDSQQHPKTKLESPLLIRVDVPEQTSLRLAKDGHIVLLPQPTDSADDPLNWSSKRKHLILLTVAWGAFCADYTSALGSAPILLQAEEWHESIENVNQTNSINVLFLALGGLIWVPATSFIGRAPTLFWSTLFGFIFTIAAAVSPTFPCFYAMRALQGLTITSCQTIAMAFIKDIFFFHERARKIGLWALLYIASPYLGPLFANFILGSTNRWRLVFWTGVAACGIDLILIIAFLDETWYNREIPPEQQPPRGRGFGSRMLRIVGVWQLRHRRTYYETVYESFKKFFLTLTKPVIPLVLFVYFLCFAWAIGINISTGILFSAPPESGGYGFSYHATAYIYFSPIVAIVIGEVFGHFFNDYLARRYVKRHHGLYEPETRLIAIYPSALFQIAGLVLLGQALSRHLSVGAVVMGWGMYSFGIMTMSVAVSSYLLDAYPTIPAEVSGWTNFARAIGGFSVGYFQQPWGAKVGYDGSFGTQAGIVAFGVILIIIAQRYGRVLRYKAPAT